MGNNPCGKYDTLEEYLKDPTYINNTEWYKKHSDVLTKDGRIIEHNYIVDMIILFHPNRGFAIGKKSTNLKYSLKLFRKSNIETIAQFADIVGVGVALSGDDYLPKETILKAVDECELCNLAYIALYSTNPDIKKKYLDLYHYCMKTFKYLK